MPHKGYVQTAEHRRRKAESLRASTPSRRDARHRGEETAVEVFRALPGTAQDLSERTELPYQIVLGRLKFLERTHFVEARRFGKKDYWTAIVHERIRP